MRNLLCLLGLALSIAACGSIHAADAAKDTKPAAPAGTDASFKGHLVKGDAGVAALNVTGEDPKAAKKKINLYADGDLATQVAELLKKHSSVEVSGLLAPDGVTMKLAKIEEVKDAKGSSKDKKTKTP